MLETKFIECQIKIVLKNSIWRKIMFTYCCLEIISHFGRHPWCILLYYLEKVSQIVYEDFGNIILFFF